MISIDKFITFSIFPLEIDFETQERPSDPLEESYKHAISRSMGNLSYRDCFYDSGKMTLVFLFGLVNSPFLYQSSALSTIYKPLIICEDANDSITA